MQILNLENVIWKDDLRVKRGAGEELKRFAMKSQGSEFRSQNPYNKLNIPYMSAVLTQLRGRGRRIAGVCWISPI